MFVPLPKKRVLDAIMFAEHGENAPHEHRGFPVNLSEDCTFVQNSESQENVFASQWFFLLLLLFTPARNRANFCPKQTNLDLKSTTAECLFYFFFTH